MCLAEVIVINRLRSILTTQVWISFYLFFKPRGLNKECFLLKVSTYEWALGFSTWSDALTLVAAFKKLSQSCCSTRRLQSDGTGVGGERKIVKSLWSNRTERKGREMVLLLIRILLAYQFYKITERKRKKRLLL